MNIDDIFFKTDLFDVEQGEDEETNPGLYGKQLASWLREQYSNMGYTVEDIIPEDWGWCVMCQREPYWLWVGCSSVLESEPVKGLIPEKNEITWRCFAAAEVSLFKRLFKRTETAEGLAKFKAELLEIIQNENALKIVNEP